MLADLFYLVIYKGYNVIAFIVLVPSVLHLMSSYLVSIYLGIKGVQIHSLATLKAFFSQVVCSFFSYILISIVCSLTQITVYCYSVSRLQTKKIQK